MQTQIHAVVRRRVFTYLAVAAGLILLAIALDGVEWRTNAHVHTVMEALATQLAIGVGIMALVRYYTRKDNTFLLLGAGFLGTAFLDGYHAVVTSDAFRFLMPSELPSLIPWSWSSSRLFLSVVLFLSWVAWRREQKLGSKGTYSEKAVYAVFALFTLASFVFFAQAPLPVAYFPNLMFPRPEEFVPAFFFLAAFIGYWHKGQWRTDQFEHWIMLSLVVGFCGQAAFMAHSGALFDDEFSVAHLLKKASYLCVLVGLLISVYATFRQTKELGLRLSAFVDNTADGIVTINRHGTIETLNPAVEAMFGYSSDELLGRNVSQFLIDDDRVNCREELEQIDFIMARFIERPREMECRRKDGSTFLIELSVSNLEYEGQTKYAGIIRDITDRKRAEKMKNEFVSTVSHELRTPLTSIKGALGLVQAGAVGELLPDTKSLVGIAYKNSDRLVRLINDILDIEKIEAGKMDFQMETHNLSELLSNAIDANAGFADQYGVALELSSVEPRNQIYGDAYRLQQVFVNLLSNAVKFSPRGGNVKIAVARIETGYRISFHDDGPGIPEEYNESIFEKFCQVDASDNRQKGGTGLGLHIAKSIIDTHKGKLYFESKSNLGTTFFVDLPDVTLQSDIPETIKRQQSEPAIPSHVSHIGGQPQILHVEDDQDVQRIVSFVLEGVANVTSVGNVAEARSAINSKHFDLVVLDLGLPDGDGEELLPALTQRHGGAIPVVVFSAREISRSVAQRVSASLMKSRTSNEVLLETIQATVEARAATVPVAQ